MEEPSSGFKGGFASGYLNKWQMKALDNHAKTLGLKRHQWVTMIIMERLVAEDLVPKTDLERCLEKIEYRKEHPHGNSKEAKAMKAAAEEQPLTLAQKRAARRRRLASKR